jgi:hypothetical protein
VFKNFDKMRLIMFNPDLSQKDESEGKKMKKSYSLNKFGDSDHLQVDGKHRNKENKRS